MLKKILIKSMSLFLFMLMLTFFIIGDYKNIKAADNLQPLTSSTGSELKYRNSSEKVMTLKEYDYPTSEFRGVWVSTFVGDIPEYTTKEKFISDANKILDNMELMGMNAIVFHVRTHNNALYRSDLNPIASWWTDVDFDKFDPLEWLITECHNRGIEFHAWMNPYRIDTSGFVGEAYPKNHPCNNSSLILSNGSGKILDPASEIVQDFIVDTCMEFLDRYDADAIHFDDYFYISGVATDISDDEKRNNVDKFIEKLSKSIHSMNEKENRAVQLGISPSGIYRNGSYQASPSYDSNGSLLSPIASNTSGFAHYGNYLYSDTKKWIDNEWIDYILPQSYWGIEHNGANFYELTRWWSWCVKYKKVNLFMGMGIYMAESTGSSAAFWKRNNNEVKNQLLNAGMYEEIHGICMYKYSTLLNLSNTIIKNGVDIISNDYWKKRVPGAPYQQYVNSIPSIKVSNLTVNNGILSWDKIDNVFGYMVYQVPVGEELDQNNINHLLVYTQDNVISNVDTLNYKYYVSSVNRANVISTPVQFGSVEVEDYEIVNMNIEKLPSNITLDLENTINSIRKKYDSLSQADKEKVINLDKLVNAENIISKLKIMKSEVDDFLKSVNTKINTNRILPVQEGMRWVYKNNEDAKKYNITTGERLKNYLTSYMITLVLEYSKDNLLYQTEVEFDLSLLKEGEIGLVYRNDPSSMSEDHVGAHTGQSTFIGWSNVTLTVDKYVLFIAKNNYYELSSNDIPMCVWTSCAGVYKNISTSNISIKLSQAFNVESSTYGYFVVSSQNKVKEVSTSSKESMTVTLLQNETLVIVRYLDRIINESPYNDITNIKVGMNSFLTKFNNKDLTDKENGEAIAAMIDALPKNVSLNDETKINEVKSEYDKLSDAAKAYVSNYQTLVDRINDISRLKDELQNKKSSAIKEINNYQNIEDYSKENQELISSIIKNSTSSINSAKSIEDVELLLKNYKALIDDILTKVEEMTIYVNEEIEKAFGDFKYDDYSVDNQVLIKQYIDSLKADLTNQLDKLDKITVDQKILQVQGKINQILTIEEELEQAIEQARINLEEYVSKNRYSENNQEKVVLILYNGLTELTNCTDINEIENIENKYKSLIDEIETYDQELSKYKKTQNALIDETLKSSTAYIYALSNDASLLSTLDDLLKKQQGKINESVTFNLVNKAVTEFKNELEKHNLYVYAIEQYDQLKKEIIFANYSQSNQELILKLINDSFVSIEYGSQKDLVDNAISECKIEINKIPTKDVELLNKIEELKEYLRTLSKENLTEEKSKEVDTLIEKYMTIVDNAKTIEELDNLKIEINTEYQKIIDNNNQPVSKKGCANCKKSNMLIMIFNLLAISFLLIKRKK